MLTKTQIAKLSVEDQELLAKLELSKTRQREQLLKEARGLDWRSRYFPLYVFAVVIILAVLYYFDTSYFQRNPVTLYFLAAMFVVAVDRFHIQRLNRRLDALLELLDFDHKSQNDSNSSKDEEAG